MEKSFETHDVYLASAITLLLKQPPEYKLQNGKILFVFPISDGLYRAMSAYNGGESVNIFEYAQTLKRLRAEMFMRRGMEGQK